MGHALLYLCKSKRNHLQLHVYCSNNAAVESYLGEGFVIGKKQVEEATGQEEYEMKWERHYAVH